MQPWTMADGTLPAFSFVDVAAGAEKKAERPEEGASICNPTEAAAVLQLLIDLHVRILTLVVSSGPFPADTERIWPCETLAVCLHAAAHDAA